MAVDPTSLLLGAIFLAEGIIWPITIVLLGDRLSALIRRPRIRRRLERLTGVVMIGFGLRQATEHRQPRRGWLRRPGHPPAPPS